MTELTRITCSPQDMADLTGLTLQRIYQLADSDVIDRQADGTFPLVESTRRYCEYARGISRGTTDAKAERAERTRLMGIKADLAALEHGEKTGELIRADVVYRNQHKAGTVLKNNLLSVPDRVAAILAAESDPHKVHTLLGDEIRASLEQCVLALEAGADFDDASLDIVRRDSLAAQQQAQNKPDSPDLDEDEPPTVQPEDLI